ncbi:MAG: FMN-dependent dehydrogenase [Treponema sp.]|nr:FMN-dependent dehydrogenase [Treponema sp.]
MSFKNFKCNFCQRCLGFGCQGQMPGMGGVNDSLNFQLNCNAWKKYTPTLYNYENAENLLPQIRLAPITGSVENIGYPCEEKFYYHITQACKNAQINLSVGDGFPDFKFQYGVHAIEKLNLIDGTKAAFFIKPYTNDKIFERIEWSQKIASHIGIDIDSFNILTMKKLVQLEKKSASQLNQIKKSIKVPFVLKGIFTKESVELVKEVKPDVVVVSNHGGRIETETGSTADFLNNYGLTLSNYCEELWVDGGLRTFSDLLAARFLGATEVLIGRPLVSALCSGGEKKVWEFIHFIQNPEHSFCFSF